MLDAGASRTLTITLDDAWLTGGTYAARLDAETDGAAVASLPVTLRVAGVPRLVLRRTAVIFGDVPLGMTARDSLYVGNAGTAPLVASVAVSGGFAASPTSVTVAPGDSALVRVSFAAGVAGDQTGALTFTTDDPAAPTRSVALRARGVRGPEIGLAPASIAAGVAAGASASRALVVSNTGGQPLVYTARIESADGGVPTLFGIASGDRIGLYDPATFRLIRAFPTGTTFGGFDALATDGTLVYYIPTTTSPVQVFDPVTGAEVRRFTMPGGATNGLAHDGTRLFGNGGLSQRDVLRLSPDGLTVEARFPLPFGTVFDGDMAAADGVLYLLTRTQNGAGPYQVLRLDAETGAVLGAFPVPSPSTGRQPVGIAVAGADLLVAVSPSAVLVLDAATGALRRESPYLSGDGPRGALAFSSRYVPWASILPPAGTVEADGSAAATVRFDAAALTAGTYRGNVVVASNDAARPEARVPFALTVTGTPAISVVPSEVRFGSVYTGGVAYRDLTVRNTGTAPLALTVATPDASVTASPAAATVAPGGRLSVALRYAPTAAGELAAPLTITSNDPERAALSVALSGQADAAPVAEVVAPDAVVLSALAGTAARASVTIRNTGASPLRYGIVGRPAGAPPAELYAIPRGETAIRRLDGLTGAPLGAVPLSPQTTAGPLAASAGSLFYVSGGAASARLVALDRAQGSFLSSVALRIPQVGALAHDGRTLYLLGGSGGGFPVLVQLDERTGATQSVPYLGSSRFPQSGLAAGRGALFVGVFVGTLNGPPRNEIDRFDPVTGAILGSLPRYATPDAYVDGRLYLDGKPSDPATGDPVLGPALDPDAFMTGWGPTATFVTPTFGTIAPGAEAVVEVAFPTAGLSAGTVEGTLAILTDDPQALETVRPVALTITGATASEAPPPAAFALSAPSPNPSRDVRALRLTLPAAAQVRVSVFDATGRLVQDLAARDLGPGVHAVNLSGAFPAGVYTVRVQAGAETAVQRFVVVL